MSTPDIVIINEGSLILFVPQTDEARTWLQENTDNESSWLGAHTLCCEPRYAAGLAEGITEAGFTIN